MRETVLKFNGYVGKVEKLLLAVIVGSMVLILVFSAFMRFVLNRSLAFSEELGSVLMISAAYIGSIYAVRNSKHIRMVALSELGGFKFAKVLNYFTCTIASVSFIVFGVMCSKYMMMVYQTGRRFMTFPFPQWIVWIPVCTGLIGTGAQYLIIIILNVIDRKNITKKEEIWVGSEIRLGDSGEQ